MDGYAVSRPEAEAFVTDTDDPPVSGEGSEAADAVSAEFVWSETPPTLAVIRTVAAATDQEPATMPPLSARIDPDALDALFEIAEIQSKERDVSVSFQYDRQTVTVWSSGRVAARQSDS